MKGNFLKIPNRRFEANKVLLHAVYIHLKKNERMVKIRDAGFFFDEASLGNYLKISPELFISIEHPDQQDPEKIPLYQEAPKPIVEAAESKEALKKTPTAPEPEKAFASDANEEEKTEQRFDPDFEAEEESHISSTDPEEEPSFTFSPSSLESDLVPIHSTKDLREILEEFRIQGSPEGQDMIHETFIQSERFQSELIRVITTNLLTERARRIAESLLSEKSPKKKKILLQSLNETMEELRKVKNGENITLPPKEAKVLAKRLADFQTILRDKTLSREEFLKKLAGMVDSLQETQEDAAETIERALKDAELKSKPNSESEEERDQKKTNKKKSERPASTKAIISNLATMLAYNLGYINKYFLQDIAIAAIAMEEIAKPGSTLDRNKLPPWPRQLLDSFDAEPSDTVSSDANQVLRMVHAYISHEKFNPRSPNLEPVLFEEVCSESLQAQSGNAFNLERWRQFIEKGASVHVHGYCRKITHGTLKLFSDFYGEQTGASREKAPYTDF